MALSKNAVLIFLLTVLTAAAAFAQSEIRGKLIKAAKNGTDITGLFEPIVSIYQEETLGIKSLKIVLPGVRRNNSKTYEFYNDSKTGNPIIWKRRMRGVGVRPICAYIATAETGERYLLYINYEYKDSKGFGSVDFIISTEK